MMRGNMAKIKVIVATGAAFPEAVKAALGMSVREFAQQYDLLESTVSGVINGSAPSTYHRVRDVLAEHLGVERAWIDEQLAALKTSAEKPAA